MLRLARMAGQLTDGDTVTLNINYAAGHQSQIMSFDGVQLRYDDTECPRSRRRQAHRSSKSVHSNRSWPDSNLWLIVPAPNAIVPGGYSVTCTLPSQNVQPDARGYHRSDRPTKLGRLRGRERAISSSPCSASTATSPPCGKHGVYKFLEENLVDTSADTFTCCPQRRGLFKSLSTKSARRALVQSSSRRPERVPHERRH